DFGSTSKLEIELGGLGAGSLYDQLSVSGTVDLRGRLNVNLINSFVPGTGNTFVILLTAGLLGSFDEANGLIIDGSTVFDLVANGNNLELVAVDVDQAFTAGSDTQVGAGLTRDVLRGGAGDDDLQGISGNDILYGEQGDDLLQVDSAFTRVDGGPGIDTLLLKDSLDLQGAAGTRIDRVEILSLADGDSDVVDLDGDAIRLMVDGDNALTGFADSLVVLGNEGDVLRAHGDFVPAGSANLDPGDGQGTRSFAVYEEAGVRLYMDDAVLLEVHRGDGTQAVYGSRFDDLIDSGQGDEDELRGGQGDDQLVFDASDLLVDGGPGIDSLLVESIDLTGVTSISNIEQIDMTNGSPDTLQLDMADLLSFVGDNELDNILPNGQTKLVIEGDGSDTIILDGQDLGNISGNVLPPGVTSDFTAQDYFGTSEQYIKFVSIGIELYVHEGLVDPDPLT
ncbi:MAG: hypothetical protein O2868_18670, partial [Proteobacteria bacterium]|nr:hypothetical protein [Pseudomonadota bacterium]